MNNGNLIQITCTGYGAPLFTDQWKRGDQPPLLSAGTIGTILSMKKEDKFLSDSRTFIKILTAEGIGWINSAFCKVI